MKQEELKQNKKVLQNQGEIYYHIDIKKNYLLMLESSSGKSDIYLNIFYETTTTNVSSLRVETR